MATKSLGPQASTDDHLIKTRVLRGVYAQCKLAEWTRTSGTSTTAATLAVNTFYGSVILPGRNCTIDQVAVNVVVAGGSSTLRMGLYSLTYAANGTPSVSLLADAGTVASTTTGVKTVTLGAAQAIKMGQPVLFGVVFQGTTTPQIHFVRDGRAIPAATAATGCGNFGLAYQATGVSGALPSTPTLVVNQSSVPVLAFHCSV